MKASLCALLFVTAEFLASPARSTDLNDLRRMDQNIYETTVHHVHVLGPSFAPDDWWIEPDYAWYADLMRFITSRPYRTMTAAEIGELVWQFQANKFDTAKIRMNSAERRRRMTLSSACRFYRTVLNPDLFEQLCAAAI